MYSMDKAEVDKLLLQLEEGGFIDPRYRFVKQNNELNLLGSGGFSYVYEMHDLKKPDKHYAAKIIGLGRRIVDEKSISETTRIQHFLSEQSENVMRVIALWAMKLHLDEMGNLVGVTHKEQEEYDTADGILLDIILMEKLDSIIYKDKYGNTELLRDDLKTEEGVIRLAENIGRALFAVHNNGFLHRDVKLENIFWDPDLAQYKLGDFGIARYVGDEGAETVVFTDGYGAPEIEKQLADSYNLTADIYSFGITLFLLLNDLKFPASNGYYANIVQYSKDFIVPAPVNASEKISAIVRMMCSYRASDRYQSVEEILMDIGRIDGSFTDQGFTEYDDIDTVTYREEDDAGGVAAFENKEKNAANTAKERPSMDGQQKKLTREERKRVARFEEEYYTSFCIRSMLITAFLAFFMLKSFSPEASYLSDWKFWILPIAVFTEAVLLQMKEFHVGFGIITIGLAVFSMYQIGIDVPQIVAIIAVIVGIPAVTAGVSIGMGLWIVQMLSGHLLWLDFCSRWDIGWVALIFLVFVIHKSVFVRNALDKSNKYETHVVLGITISIPFLMLVCGIVLLLSEHFSGIAIPDILKHIHLIRTGIGIWLAEMVYFLNFRLEDDKVAQTDEPLDK